MTPLFSQKVTIYNSIPKTAVEDRHWDRYVIPLCNIQGGVVEKADGTIRNVINSISVITKAIQHYKPLDEYMKLPVDKRADYFTAKTGDFIVFGEVADNVSTAQEFADLQTKYKEKGIKVNSFNAFLYGMGVDNISFSNV